MRFENVFCEEHGKPHFVQVIQHDTQGRITKTKCHGVDFVPVVNNATHYTRHKHRGYNIIAKIRSQPKKKYPSTFKRERFPIEPVVVEPIERKCLVEYSMSVRKQFVTIKVFDNATPDKFYEFFFEVSDKPKMIKSRNLGQEKPVHILDTPSFYKAEGKTNIIWHDRQAYERLLTADFNSSTFIMENNNNALRV